MGLRTLVYISSVSDLHDARYCAGMGVGLVGICLSPEDPNFVSAETFKEMKSWLSGLEYVGELKGEPEVSVSEYEPDYLLISDISHFEAASAYEKPLILRVDVSDFEHTAHLANFLSEHTKRYTYFLLSKEKVKTLSSEEEAGLLTLAQEYPILLGFGFSGENINRCLDKLPVKGISLYGSSQIIVGMNDFDEAAEVLEAIEIEDEEVIS